MTTLTLTDKIEQGKCAVAGQPADGQFKANWRTIAIWLLVVTLVSLGTLSVVATVKKADPLSTVALALAVLAFAAQLVVSITQSQFAARQLAEAERVSNETRNLLTQLSGTSEAMLANQKDLFERVLGHVLGDSVAPTAEDATEGPGDAAASVGTGPDKPASSVAAEVRKLIDSHGVKRGTPYQHFIDTIRSWPPREEGLRALATLKKMTPFQAASLLKRALRDVEQAELGREPGLWSRKNGDLGPITSSLKELGLIEYLEESPGGAARDGYLFRRLSPEGVSVARLLLPTGAPPEWYERS